MLLGDMTETGGGLVALALAAGGGVGWLLQWLSSRRKDQRTEYLEDQKRDAERWDQLYERIKTDREDARKREEQCQSALAFIRSQISEVQMRAHRMVERIQYLEERLDEHKIPHRKWLDREFMGDHGEHESPEAPEAPEGGT